MRSMRTRARGTPAVPAPDEGHGGDGRSVRSSSRVVREPGRGSRLAAAATLLALVAAGAVLVLGGSRDAEGGDDGSEHARDTARRAYHEAVARFGGAGSFAYRGSVRAALPSRFRPGPSTATDVTVEGEVLLPPSITREVAVDGEGNAVETVTSGPSVWSRTAPSTDTLADAAWAAVGPSRSSTPVRVEAFREERGSRLGIALVSNVLRSAVNPSDGEPDAAGRRVIHAALPGDPSGESVRRCPLCYPYGEVLDGGGVTVALDDAGDIAHIVVMSASPDPRIVLDLDIERLGEPGVITPADVDEPARRTLPLDVLAAAGVEAVELGVVPPGWALTDASIETGTPKPPTGCGWLRLEYRDLGAVADGWLRLTVTGEECFGGSGAIEGEPFRAGSFQGTIWRGGGTVSDGTTRVQFETDLPAADVATLLASLTPLDPPTAG